ncbi:hypothetical protein [Thioalkalivibrio thiocyanodenitrificans]|jgi:hypothetical protein|uniref:hypothetical protein n=1 Tax=Thioalkalivibrio thiocyanodenitrificans TaxID=243063 RepID=UPI0003A0494C|nr:hypothetical protein [Thioalkalivibrio thiocyanodenitrificans]
MIRMSWRTRGSATTTGSAGRMHTGIGRRMPRMPACRLHDTVPAPREPMQQ